MVQSRFTGCLAGAAEREGVRLIDGIAKMNSPAMILVICLLLGATSHGVAGQREDAKVALHLQPRLTKVMICDREISSPMCHAEDYESNMIVNGAVNTPYDMYILLLDFDEVEGVAGVRFSIELDLDALYLQESLCADRAFPDADWPAAFSNTSVSFDAIVNCQNEANGAVDPNDTVGNRGLTKLYAFYVYAYEQTQIRLFYPTAPHSSYESMYTCAGEAFTPIPENNHDLCPVYGWVGFGGEWGCSPCGGGLTLTEATTWGSIKSGFRNEGRR